MLYLYGITNITSPLVAYISTVNKYMHFFKNQLKFVIMRNLSKEECRERTLRQINKLCRQFNKDVHTKVINPVLDSSDVICLLIMAELIKRLAHKTNFRYLLLQ